MPNLILVYRGEEMAYVVKKFGDHRERRSYSKTKNAIELSNLLEIQKKSYEWFMTEGIKEVFDDIFPVESIKKLQLYQQSMIMEYYMKIRNHHQHSKHLLDYKNYH